MNQFIISLAFVAMLFSSSCVNHQGRYKKSSYSLEESISPITYVPQFSGSNTSRSFADQYRNYVNKPSQLDNPTLRKMPGSPPEKVIWTPKTATDETWPEFNPNW